MNALWPTWKKPEAPALPPIVIPPGTVFYCGSPNLEVYHATYGKPGEFRYSTEEGIRCRDCKRTRLPLVLSPVLPVGL